MILLESFWQLPMVWSFLVPLGGALVLCGILLWDSRIPKSKFMMRHKGTIIPYKHRLQRTHDY